MNKYYVDGCYEARGPIGAYCIVVCREGKATDWFVAKVEPHLASQVEYEGVKEAIRLAAYNLPARVISDSVTAIKRYSELAKRNNVELKHIPGHLAGKEGVEVTDDVKKHNWAHVQALNFVRHISKDLMDSGNRIKGLDRINKSVL